tara:strand:+ start:19023 stop:19748 length:726 start_codon:yes stop_codon:yes gene_type:complete
MVEIIGHRGASSEAPENTLASNHLAFQQGADGVEVDVRLTKDNKLVCIHDKTTLRTANKELVISESTLKQLKSLDVGNWKGNKWRGESIPSLEEILETIPKNKKIFIEVKVGIESIAPLIEEIQKSKMEKEKITIISFHEKVVEEVKRSIEAVTANLLIAFSGQKGVKNTEVLKKLIDYELDGVGIENHFNFTQDFIGPILKANKKVHVWTVDSIKESRIYKEMGVSSITTNLPEKIKSSL